MGGSNELIPERLEWNVILASNISQFFAQVYLPIADKNVSIEAQTRNRVELAQFLLWILNRADSSAAHLLKTNNQRTEWQAIYQSKLDSFNAKSCLSGQSSICCLSQCTKQMKTTSLPRKAFCFTLDFPLKHITELQCSQSKLCPLLLCLRLARQISKNEATLFGTYFATPKQLAIDVVASGGGQRGEEGRMGKSRECDIFIEQLRGNKFNLVLMLIIISYVKATRYRILRFVRIWWARERAQKLHRQQLPLEN